MTFRVLLIAGDGPLPDDTALTVKHRGTVTEEFRLDRPFPGSDVVFCCRSTREGECAETPDAGLDAESGPVPVEGVLCELWTDGAARVTVTAKGYPMLDQNLEAKSVDGCIQTKDVRLLLERPDAGP